MRSGDSRMYVLRLVWRIEPFKEVRSSTRFWPFMKGARSGHIHNMASAIPAVVRNRRRIQFCYARIPYRWCLRDFEQPS
jgi:hypothetical protein